MRFSKASPWAKSVGSSLLVMSAVAASFAAPGCIDRPVVSIPPGDFSLHVGKVRVQRPDKLDLLFMIDNSASMLDKQSELSRRIPELIASLTDPTPDPETGKAANVLDIHVGVITSSMGSHGTNACSTNQPQNDDHAHLMPRDGGYGSKGYVVTAPGADPTPAACPGGVMAASPVSWVFDPEKASGATFKGSAGATDLQTATSCVVASVDQQGCGYEHQLEAVYHFLIDPAPYATANVACKYDNEHGDQCNGNIVVSGVDEEILKERKAFLRPDSLVAVILLTDENDAGIQPAGKNWVPYAYRRGAMQRGWAGCADVPDDFEPETPADYATLLEKYHCKSCFQDDSDPNCKVPWPTPGPTPNIDVDAPNLRAFHDVQRFGFNFLWGRQRFVDAFTAPMVPDSMGKLGVNPLLANGRTKDQLIVAAIVGVPHDLVSDEEGNPKQLTEADWDKIIGPVGKRDPHMIESIAPRDGVPKFTGDRSVDPVNGGDRDISDGGDLQFACIAERATKDVSDSECAAPGADKVNPLCGPGSTQPYFKAYPGLRELRVVHDLGASGFVASICNKSFHPAIVGITKKVKDALVGECVHSDVTLLPDGSANCLVIESLVEDSTVKHCEEVPGLCTPGAAPCRQPDTDYPPVSPETASAQLTLRITVIGNDGASQTEQASAFADGKDVYIQGSDGRKHLVCEQMQLAGARTDGATANACLHDPKFKLPASAGGWCYSSDPAVLGADCKEGTIRFAGAAEPRNKSEVFTICVKSRTDAG